MTGRQARIPADIEREDRIVAGLTARQVLKLTLAAVLAYAGWALVRPWVPTVAYLAPVAPVAVVAVVVVLARRDGVALDELLVAALRQRLQPRRRVAHVATAPVPGWVPAPHTREHRVGELDLPARGVQEAGVVDLGADGVAMIAATSTVNFALRTPAEQDALVAALGRWLHSLSQPAQILVRTVDLDLSEQIAQLRFRAPGLPHPALERAALDHAHHLEHLAARIDLLRRQVLIILREPEGTPATRLLQRLTEAAELLGSAAGITVTPLDAAQATAVLTAACSPGALITPPAALAAADDVITTTAEWEPES